MSSLFDDSDSDSEPDTDPIGSIITITDIVVVGDRGHVLLSFDHADSWTQVLVLTQSMLCAVRF